MGIVSAVLLLSACTRALVPLGATPMPLASTAEADATQGPEWAIPEGEISYSVFGVASDAHLLVRQPAGISGTIVADLPPDMQRLSLTGQRTTLGSSTWIEIAVPSGSTGWINLWNVTEEIDPAAFCLDPRVPALMDAFFAALRDRSGEALASVVSPRRGLVLRHDWWNPEIVISPAEVASLMQRIEEMDWGVQRGSGAPIVGSFRDRLLPELDELLAAAPQEECNALLTGSAGVAAEWPDEYARMNFLSYHIPAPDTGSRFNWRSWAFGIEYVDGVPFLAILVRYQGDL